MLIVGHGCAGPARRCGGAARSRAELAEALRHGHATSWNGFNVLHTAAARVGGLDLGLVPGEGGRDVAGILAGADSGEIEAVFLIGADEIDTGRLGKAFVVYQGHHGDRGAAGGRRDPAGRRLHREERELGQHRGPAAARQARGVPAGRGQGGLEDPARALRGARPHGAARHAGPGARPDGRAGAAARRDRS